MRIISAFFIVFALVASSQALQCYFCVGSSEDSDCASGVIESMAVEECLDTTLVEQCVSLSAVLNDMTFYERGCAYIEEGVDACEQFQGQVTELLSCNACDTDLCNA